MREQIVSYIKVLKDRRKVFNEYLMKCEKSANREDAIQYSGMIEAIDDIIAELKGFVKPQNPTPYILDSLGYQRDQDLRVEIAKAKKEKTEENLGAKEIGVTEVTKGRYTVAEEDYDVEASGGPPDPTQKGGG